MLFVKKHKNTQHQQENHWLAGVGGGDSLYCTWVQVKKRMEKVEKGKHRTNKQHTLVGISHWHNHAHTHSHKLLHKNGKAHFAASNKQYSAHWCNNKCVVLTPERYTFFLFHFTKTQCKNTRFCQFVSSLFAQINLPFVGVQSFRLQAYQLLKKGIQKRFNA